MGRRAGAAPPGTRTGFDPVPRTAVCPAPSVGTKPAVTIPRAGIPAYIHPGAYAADWDRILAGGSDAVAVVVANVADGPGRQRDEAWATVIGRARRAGVAVLGYVDSGYLGRASPPPLGRREGDWLGHILADVAAWYAFYGDDLGGVFFDRADRSCEGAAVYGRLSDDVRRRAPGALSALNPGGVVPPCFDGAADLLLVFEGTAERYLGSGPTAGELDWSPSSARLWHVVYGTPPALVDDVVERGRRRDAHLLYVTDRSGANPWRTVASYWERLAARMTRTGDPATPHDRRS